MAFDRLGFIVDIDPTDVSVFLGMSLIGTPSQNEITDDREELVGRIDSTSWSNTSTPQAVNPPHFTSPDTTITPDQAIQSDPLVIFSITPSDNVWVPSRNPMHAPSANCVRLVSTFVVRESSSLILIFPELVRGRLIFEGSGPIGWNEV